jgi:cell division protein FtsB
MTTTNDGGPNTTNAGPVLPHLDADPRYFSLQAVTAARAYGAKCWNACDEQVAGPLRERVAELERECDRLRAENEALRAGIDKAISEIDDGGPKALKYAREELVIAKREDARAAREG